MISDNTQMQTHMSSSPSYPQCLADELAKFGLTPTADLEHDRERLHTARASQEAVNRQAERLAGVVRRWQRESQEQRASLPDLTIPEIYDMHARCVKFIADEIVLSRQRRLFEIDDHNKDILRFLLYYFNECPLAEDVFPGRGYKLHKNIMLQGGVGTGKTLIMQIFSEYLRRLHHPRYFRCVSVTEMVNYFTIHNNIDLFVYNEQQGDGFKIAPFHICLDDLGVENRPFYGIDTLTVCNDFLHARNELWSYAGPQDMRYTYLTTNLNNAQLKDLFDAKDDYGRIIDRFKTYNVIPLTGSSRR